MNDQAPATLEERIEGRLDKTIAGELTVSQRAGGVSFANAGQAMEFAKMMAISSISVPKHLRGNPGACLAIVIQAIEWRLSPFAVANKSYSVNDRIAYESQLIQAVILQRAPLDGRFKVEYSGEGAKRVCRVWAKLRGSGEIVDYESPEFGTIQPKNSPLWKNDPDQQFFYYSARALCRRHFPDVLLGVYAKDELEDYRDPEDAIDVTPRRSPTLESKLDALASMGNEETSAGGSHPEADQGAGKEPQQGQSPSPAPDQSSVVPPTTTKAAAVEAPQDAPAAAAPQKAAGASKAETAATAPAEVAKPASDAPAPPQSNVRPTPATVASPGGSATSSTGDTTPTTAATTSPMTEPVGAVGPLQKKALIVLHRAMENAMSHKGVQKGLANFLADNQVEEGSKFFAAATSIAKAHFARVAGDSSPHDADQEVKKVLA